MAQLWEAARISCRRCREDDATEEQDAMREAVDSASELEEVKSAQASGGGSALRSCVVSAVKRAKFKKTQKGMSVTYPFVFR